MTISILFFSTVASLLDVAEAGPLDTSLIVLDWVLLIFIFAELLNTIGIIVRESEMWPSLSS